MEGAIDRYIISLLDYNLASWRPCGLGAKSDRIKLTSNMELGGGKELIIVYTRINTAHPFAMGWIPEMEKAHINKNEQGKRGERITQHSWPALASCSLLGATIKTGG